MTPVWALSDNAPPGPMPRQKPIRPSNDLTNPNISSFPNISESHPPGWDTNARSHWTGDLLAVSVSITAIIAFVLVSLPALLITMTWSCGRISLIA